MIIPLKKQLFPFLLLIIGLFTFSSCEDTGDDPLGDLEPVPVITLSQSSATVTAGESVQVNYSVVAEARLESIQILLNGTTFSTINPDDFTNNDSHSGVFTYTTNGDEAGTTITFTFQVQDRRDRISSEDFVVTVEEDIPEIAVTSYQATLLGAHNNANTGSFYDAEANRVYLLADARSNPGLIDFVYYYGATNEATLAAPNDGTIREVLPQIEQFTTRNATTMLRTDLSESDFDNIGDLAGIQVLTAFDEGTVPAEETRTNELSAGDVIAFRTVDGLTGLVKVNEITGTTTGTMNIDVKVVQQ